VDLTEYDVILINTSAGKDSQAMMDLVVKLAEEQGVKDRLVAVHADLGRVEWPGTKELAEEHAKHYGIRFEVVRRTGRGGIDLLGEIRHRGKWPSNTERYCTSYYKREPVLKLMTQLADELRARKNAPVKILNCYGFRAEESPRRRKLPQHAVYKRATNGKRLVWDWLPIQDWTEDQVWERIRNAGTRHHPAYDLGMKRLSCSFCIFSPKSALMVAAKARPDLWAEYVQAEKNMGHTFRKELSLVQVDEAIKAGEQAGTMDGVWNM
jgi:3'-phosphoadenosine 5'-phosphosulfate sulfotransferase (PAPS reductase)/FAD synthetase